MTDYLPDLDTLDDDTFIAAFERGEIPARAFHHRHHLRMAWLLLRRGDDATAFERARAGVQRLAAAHGVPQKYHHTVTVAWMEIVAHHLRRTRAGSFDDFLATAPQLLDKRLLSRHYSSSLLASRPARSGWVAPDLRPIPG